MADSPLSLSKNIDVFDKIDSDAYMIGPYAPGGPGSLIQGKGLYDRSVETLDLPNFAGAPSMFNPYVIFSLYDVGETGGDNSVYRYTHHYDMIPSGDGFKQGQSIGIKYGSDAVTDPTKLDVNQNQKEIVAESQEHRRPT